MKILWVNNDYLHPTDRGGQIRTLETLKRLHARHEVHYATLDRGENEEGTARVGEYCSRHFGVRHQVAQMRSPGFFLDLARGAVSDLPVSMSRWSNMELKLLTSRLIREERYDAIVCDFLASAANLAEWGNMVLFQHNVEASIWERHAAMGRTAAHKWYLGQQARKMRAYEGKVCRAAARVIAVSEGDARQMRDCYGVRQVDWVQTGVDTEYFEAGPEGGPSQRADLIFLGSMDWLPNIEGVAWFYREILPRIWQLRPRTSVSLVGRRPGREILVMQEKDSRIRVSGTVKDVRPWLKSAKISIVPLRIGGGTRLKIYESMAAGLPVVSTRIGAEGLAVQIGHNITIADAPDEFAGACVGLLEDKVKRDSLSRAGFDLVRVHNSWESVSRQFETLLTYESATSRKV